MPCDALYLHIPFCEQKCPYCDFYSVPARPDRMDAYTGALIRAIETAPFPMGRLDTVYFGGGTPSVMGGKRLAQILEAADRQFGIQSGAEITVECNPHSSLPETFRQLFSAGANRLSFGMQSASDRQLALLGRPHTCADVETAVSQAQQAGFSHISLDLMLATPGQTAGDIQAAVDTCARLGAEHVSAYLLKIEPGTAFAARDVGRLCPDEDGQAALYLTAAESLARAGYRQYEISNFAEDGQIARHNYKYWDCAEYLGVGPSAHSFIQGRRRFFPRRLQAFVENGNPWQLLEDDGPGGDAAEYLMLRARLADGIRWASLRERYPAYDCDALRGRAKPLADAGFLELDGEGLHLTVRGFLVSNAVIENLIG